MRENKEKFGLLPNGGEVYKITLKNGCGMSASVLNFGCILQSLLVPDKNGKADNVVLGFNTLDGYLSADGHFGEVVGRCCNRIGNSRFTLDGKEYILPANDGVNHLHGGPAGFGARLWNIDSITENSVTFSLDSDDGDMGYPGNLHATCTYELSDDGKLTLIYTAESDKATPVCMTNHSYFDLCGAGSGRTLDMTLRLDCDKICSTDKALIPDGELIEISGTPYDFSKEKPIKGVIDKDYLLLSHCKGYDTNYFAADFDGSLKNIGMMSDPVSGRKMDIYTNLPCIQLYTGNMISPDGPAFYQNISPAPHMGVCLETQIMPDAVNHPDITDPFIRPGEEYRTTTVFDFGE